MQVDLCMVTSEKKQTFVLLRYVHIAAGSYLLLWGVVPTPVLAALVVAALASNIVLATLPERRVLSLPVVLAVVTTDLAWLGAGIIVSGNASGDLLVLYLLVLLSAATAESLVVVTLTAALAGAGYLAVLSTLEPGAVWTTAHLIRVPFLFAAALACGYLVHELRGQRRQALETARLDRARGECLATVVEDLRGPIEVMILALQGLDAGGLSASPRGVEKGLAVVRRKVEELGTLVRGYIADAHSPGAPPFPGEPLRPTRGH